MALTQDSDIALIRGGLTGQTILPQLTVSSSAVHIAYVAQPSGQALAAETAVPGTADATAILSYIDLDTGLLTGTGETHAKTLSFNGATIDTYFS